MISAFFSDKIKLFLMIGVFLLLISCKYLYDKNFELSNKIKTQEQIIKDTLKKNEDLQKIQRHQQKKKVENEKNIKNRNYFDAN